MSRNILAVTFYQRMMDKDYKLRVFNQERLRELRRTRAYEVELFCARDIVEFERLSGRSAEVPADRIVPRGGPSRDQALTAINESFAIAFNGDSRNFLNMEPGIARRNLSRMNGVIADLAKRRGELVDLHAHFLRGDESWLRDTIEPSLRGGASEVRATFLPAVMRAANCDGTARPSHDSTVDDAMAIPLA